MNQREYEKLKTEANAEYRRKLEAIETVWKMSGGRNGNQPSAIAKNGALGKGRLQRAIRTALESLSGEFDVRDIYNQVVNCDPILADQIKGKLPSISNALKRMVTTKDLVLVETGSGKKPSRYRRAG